MNGVNIEELQLKGIKLPEELVLDFPLSCHIPESRNEIVVDKNIIKASKQIIDCIVKSNLFTQEDKNSNYQCTL